jgi:hypothetical protein
MDGRCQIFSKRSFKVTANTEVGLGLALCQTVTTMGNVNTGFSFRIFL